MIFILFVTFYYMWSSGENFGLFWETIFFIYNIFLFFIVYYVLSIHAVNHKTMLKELIDCINYVSVYYFAAFALFSGSLIYLEDFPNLGLQVLGVLWYLLLSIFLLSIFLIPTSYLILKDKFFWGSLYFTISLFIWGHIFSILTSLQNVSLFGIDLVLDSLLFSLLSYFELVVIIAFIVFFFKSNLNPLEQIRFV